MLHFPAILLLDLASWWLIVYKARQKSGLPSLILQIIKKMDKLRSDLQINHLHYMLYGTAFTLRALHPFPKILGTLLCVFRNPTGFRTREFVFHLICYLMLSIKIHSLMIYEVIILHLLNWNLNIQKIKELTDTPRNNTGKTESSERISHCWNACAYIWESMRL